MKKNLFELYNLRYADDIGCALLGSENLVKYKLQYKIIIVTVKI